MIPVKDEILDVQSNMTGESITMTLDVNATAHLMQILTNLYSDPAKAVIRELMTNAVDSHVSAGQNRPINIELPNSWSPTFVVQDYGLGMSLDEVKDIYSKYGASTKRNSNDVNGMLGLGAKAPLTYTSQFTMVSIKDGMQAVVIIGLNDEGVGEIQVVSHIETDEPNGVTLKIPVVDIDSFTTKFRNFIRFWPSESMMIDGRLHKQPDDLFDDTFAVGDAKVSRINTNGGYSYNNMVYVQMAGVAYPIEGDVEGISDVIGSGSYLINVPIGSVSFTPSREDLHYTERTKKYIGSIFTQLIEIEFDRINARLAAHDKISDFYFDREVILHSVTNGGLLHRLICDITFEDEVIPLNLHSQYQFWNASKTTWEDKYRKYPTAFRINNREKLSVVLDKPHDRFAGKGLTPYDMRKVREYCANSHHRSLWFTDFAPASEQGKYQTDDQYKEYLVKYAEMRRQYDLIKRIIIETQDTMTWDEFLAIKPAVNKTAAVKLPDCVRTVQPGGKNTAYSKQTEIKDLAGKKLCYVYRSELKKSDNITSYTISSVDIDYIVILNKAEAKTFFKAFPDMVSYADYLKEKLSELVVTDRMRDFWENDCRGHYTSSRLEGLNVPEVDDADVRDYADLSNDKVIAKQVQEISKSYSLAIRLGVTLPSLSGGRKFENVLNKYPLLASGYTDHNIVYINAIYARDKESE